jgi:ribosomal RNA methyltransferase Nop2
MMKNTGVLFANDSHKDRCKALRANIQRLGIRTAIVSNLDGNSTMGVTGNDFVGRKLPSVMGGFDRILLDAPCTGLGVISRDPSVKTQKVSWGYFRG